MSRAVLSVLGACCVLAAAVGFGLHQGPHAPIASWDYPDHPNTHAVTASKGSLTTPKNILVARDWSATTQDEVTVQLLAVSKGNTMNREHWWSPNGGPLAEVLDTTSYQQPDQPKATDGRIRELVFKVTASHFPLQGNISGYAPNTALPGLSPKDQPFHGWDPGEAIQIGQFPTERHVRLYVDNLKEDTYRVGLATGDWNPLGASKNELTSPPYTGKVLAHGDWGTANVIHSPMDDLNGKGIVFAHSKNIDALEVEVQSPVEPKNEEIRLLAFEKDGKPVPIYSAQNRATIPMYVLKKIASFEVQSRPIVYIEFNKIHFDPDKSLWSNAVFGEEQPTKKVQVGGITVELVALIETGPGTQDWNKERYVTKTVYTVGGNVWKDHPMNYNNVGQPRYDYQSNQNPPKELKRPWVAVMKLGLGSSTDPKPQGRIRVFGSDSEIPGTGLHASWNLTPQFYSTGPELRSLQPAYDLPIALAPEATCAQIHIECASGPYKKVVEYKPDPADIKPQGDEFRVYTLEVGNEVRVRYRNHGNQWIEKLGIKADLKEKQTRVFARMKSGKRILLQLTSLSQVGNEPRLRVCYDLDRDATETEGDMIALGDVKAFEVEARPISQHIMVVKLPEGDRK